jgi:transcriptional regulator with XRE-family HTH domain
MTGDARSTFGAAVRARRRARAWSQEELAAAAGLDRTYISGLERGVRNPSLLSQQRIADALGDTLAELMTFAEELGG